MYSRNVERVQPGCIIFLVDHSFSMRDGIAGSMRSKCSVVATLINRAIAELISRCEKGEDRPRHYYDLAVIGYTTDRVGIPTVGSSFRGPLAGRELVSVVDLYEHPLDVEARQKDDGAGELVEIRFPVWYTEPSPDEMAGTPMCMALEFCARVAGEWCVAHPLSFPPIVLHLTDGESTDGDPQAGADALRGLGTEDGTVLLFNCYLSSGAAEPVLFPGREAALPDDYARVLFRMSSPLPEPLRQAAKSKGLRVEPGARALAFQADSTIALLWTEIGTGFDRRWLR